MELKRPFDRECRWDFDVLGFIENQVASGSSLDGVFSSSDYPGAVLAGAISQRLGLPGSPPARVLASSHKYYSRISQREAVPDSTPWFQLVDPKRARGGLTELHFPCFIKPVKGAFSVMSQRLDSWEDLESFLSRPALAGFLIHYVFMFNRLVRGLTDLELDGGYFLAEDLLKGRLVTVEGYATGSTVEILGIVDSVRHAGTRSFVRFDYPSSLSRRVQTRMREVAIAVVQELQLEHTLFNIEMMYDLRRDRVFIVEVNPRMCGQFADLYENVDGRSGYDVALALAVGEPPPEKRGRTAYRVASSFPLRIFEPARVVEAPSRGTDRRDRETIRRDADMDGGHEGGPARGLREPGRRKELSLRGDQPGGAGSRESLPAVRGSKGRPEVSLRARGLLTRPTESQMPTKDCPASRFSQSAR